MCREGAAAEHLYLLLSGEVRARRNGADGSDDAPLRDPVIGAEALTRAARYGSTVVAATPVNALAVPARAAGDAVIGSMPVIEASETGCGIEAFGVCGSISSRAIARSSR